MKRALSLVLAIVLMTGVFASVSITALAGAACDTAYESLLLNGITYKVEVDYGGSEIYDVRLTAHSYYGSNVAPVSVTNKIVSGLYGRDIITHCPALANLLKNHKDKFFKLTEKKVKGYDANVNVKIVCVDVNRVADRITIPDQKPVICDGTTLLPIRAVADYFGWQVKWDANTRTATIEDRVNSVSFTIGSEYAQVCRKRDQQEKSVQLRVAPCIIGGRTMLPVRAVAECLVAGVSWDAKTYTITIESGNSTVSDKFKVDYTFEFVLNGLRYEFRGNKLSEGQRVGDCGYLIIRDYMGESIINPNKFHEGLPKGLYVNDMVKAMPRIGEVYDKVRFYDYVDVVYYGNVQFYKDASDVKFITPDNKTVVFPDQKPVMVEKFNFSPFYLPLDSLKQCGWEVQWSNSKEMAFISNNDRTIVVDYKEKTINVLYGGKGTYKVTDKYSEDDIMMEAFCEINEPFMIDHTPMIPVDALCQGFYNFELIVADSTKTIYLK